MTNATNYGIINYKLKGEMFMNTMENKVTMDLEYLGNARMGSWDCNEWKVELHYNGGTMHTPFYTGTAIAEHELKMSYPRYLLMQTQKIMIHLKIGQTA